MYELLIDGRFYSAHATAEEADAARATLRRWASCSTRIDVIPVAPASTVDPTDWEAYEAGAPPVPAPEPVEPDRGFATDAQFAAWWDATAA